MTEQKFKIGDCIKLRSWECDYYLKIIDIGSKYFIVEQMNGSIGWREIDSDWIEIKP